MEINVKARFYHFLQSGDMPLDFPKIAIDFLIGWCLIPILAIFQLYRGVPKIVNGISAISIKEQGYKRTS